MTHSRTRTASCLRSTTGSTRTSRAISAIGPRIGSVDFQVFDIAATGRRLFESHGLRAIPGNRLGTSQSTRATTSASCTGLPGRPCRTIPATRQRLLAHQPTRSDAAKAPLPSFSSTLLKSVLSAPQQHCACGSAATSGHCSDLSALDLSARRLAAQLEHRFSNEAVAVEPTRGELPPVGIERQRPAQ
jgi:hypothetical protein